MFQISTLSFKLVQEISKWLFTFVKKSSFCKILFNRAFRFAHAMQFCCGQSFIVFVVRAIKHFCFGQSFIVFACDQFVASSCEKDALCQFVAWNIASVSEA